MAINLPGLVFILLSSYAINGVFETVIRRNTPRQRCRAATPLERGIITCSLGLQALFLRKGREVIAKKTCQVLNTCRFDVYTFE